VLVHVLIEETGGHGFGGTYPQFEEFAVSLLNDETVVGQLA
jgi:hypothetical protein